jgi:hypothetical protein
MIELIKFQIPLVISIKFFLIYNENNTFSIFSLVLVIISFVNFLIPLNYLNEYLF